MTLSGSLSLGSSVAVKTYISLKYQYFELKIKNEVKVKVSLSCKDGDDTHAPGQLKFPAVGFSPVPGLFIELQPVIKFQSSASISFWGSISSVTGFSYDSEQGFKKLTSKPKMSDLTVNAEVKIFLGLVLEPRVCILNEKVAKASLGGMAGVELTTKLNKKIGDYDSTHECKSCIKGDISSKISLSCELSFLNLDKLTWEHTFGEWSAKLNDFYLSIDKKEFGWGSCPYDKHKISVQVLSGGNDFPSGGAIVKCGNEKNTTNSDGIAEILLSDGYHTITVSQDNCETVKKKIFVNGDDKTITVHISAIDPAHTSTTTAVKTTESTQTVTTTTVTAGQPDENGEYIYDGVIYKYYNYYAEVSGYTDDISNDVVLLKEVCGVPVTEIGYEAFYDCGVLTSITIPDSVTYVRMDAFRECKNLMSVTIPDSVTYIGSWAFHRCSSLTSITIPENITSIEYDTFSYCSSLTSITIPDSVTYIGHAAFVGCSNLTSVTIPDNVTSIDGFAFSECENLTSITIPDSVTYIGDYAFEECSSLISITIPDSVTYIGGDAFYETPWLESQRKENTFVIVNNILIDGTTREGDVVIPDGIISIAGRAFKYCDKLTSITIPNSVTYIGDEAFIRCDSLTSITIPDSVTNIGKEAFWWCTNLESITIPDSVTSIGGRAFELCSLTSIKIPDGVTRIEVKTFYDCYKLTSVTIPNSVTDIEIGAFEDCYRLTSITIPDGVTSIGDSAFKRSGLTSITIPDSVTSIGESAFRWCYKLTDVYYSGTESEWNEITIDSENDCLTNATIHFNSTAPAPTPAPPVMTHDNETFADLKPNTLYNFYAFTDKNAVDKLSAENLLYIAQFTTDENGNFNIPYTPIDEQILIVGAVYSIATAEINISDVVYTGSEVVPNPVVTWNGIQLTEGIDYEIDGDLSAVDIGSYKILFNGIGEFFGYTTVMYDVVCSHNFVDGICTICGETEPINQIVLGDVNEDGMVDAIDATAVLVEYANLSTVGSGIFSDEQKSAGDVNLDNMIDAVDASMILAFYAYLSTGGTENDMRVWLDM